ncbi:hypothetical protein HYN59_03150 [Flavobacterium album]|uniref:Uncharacterized protein n=1 Tax=Flavobacterium album TaxID=2175091 RepID=A0A2S1QUS2_9FLAO|nr:hypothetical protein [Flavobacterium album]AWH84170.1 hypothetical protein HYN59_03150 [Flavobacterium album]
MDFIFIDRATKRFQTFTGDKERAEHIKKKTAQLQVVYPNFEIYYNFNNPPEEELGSDWTQNQDIYDIAIFNFNQLGGEILSAWNPNR